MKYIVHKPYFNYEKEENWLNQMSAKGMALTDYSWCRYVFEEVANSQYIYRIEMLENAPTSVEGRAYLKFLEENNVDCVATYMSWAYLRKKSSEGSFDIYSDIDSRIKHYQRVTTLWNIFMWIELIVGFINLLIGGLHVWGIINLSGIAVYNLFIGSICMGLGVLLCGLRIPFIKKLKQLKREKVIRE
ncbi:MAG: DUF2812 domain-containing protein [Oscillospiraceae bacterium]